jgi:antitoxin VapB
MALNIKNPEVERLAAEVAALSKESKTEAIRKALLDRRDRLALARSRVSRSDRLAALLRWRIWPAIPAEVLGKPVSREEREAILGYGPEGV